MHQALLIPEVFLEIIAHVNQTQNPSSTAEKALARKSIAALATTCKTFHEPAMDLLWSKVDQLEPLLGCVTRLHPLIYHSGSRVSPQQSRALLFIHRLIEHLISGTTLGQRASNRYLPTRPVNFCVTPHAFAL